VRKLCGLIALLILMSVPFSAQERRDWDDLYRDGIALVSKKEWKQAEDVLLRAMKAGPPSGRNAIRRGVFGRDDYFPEFYLGIVYLFTNRPLEAQTQFQIARKRGVNLKEREFAALPEYEVRAKELVDVETTTRAAADRGQQFKRLLGEAQKLLAAARYEEAETAARQARDLNVDDSAAEAMLQNVLKARSTSRLQDALKRNPSLPELRRLLAEYDNTGAPLDELRSRIEAAEATDRRNVAERAAMVAFYSGNYSQAINALGEAEKALALTTRGQFYRAVTLATQATRGKTVNQGLLQRARNAWQTASREPDAFRADLKYISPDIIRQLEGK
jgi:hypothetical protein